MLSSVLLPGTGLSWGGGLFCRRLECRSGIHSWGCSWGGIYEDSDGDGKIEKSVRVGGNPVGEEVRYEFGQGYLPSLCSCRNSHFLPLCLRIK